MVSAATATATRLIQNATSSARPNSRAPRIASTMTRPATRHASRQFDQLGLSQAEVLLYRRTGRSSGSGLLRRGVDMKKRAGTPAERTNDMIK